MLQYSAYQWADGQTVSCYVYEPNKSAEFLVFKIKSAQESYPNLTTDKAIELFAKRLFMNKIVIVKR